MRLIVTVVCARIGALDNDCQKFLIHPRRVGGRQSSDQVALAVGA